MDLLIHNKINHEITKEISAFKQKSLFMLMNKFLLLDVFNAAGENEHAKLQ